ncbi:hypothetical protein RchiOBHm_Chr6g0245911 [Rosa chinensis]|uniref:Uncharacterized protein n=1 Tax=Rosa chinensis TaxID=74649 RepID=A0A2P6PJD5_ROSCH|nr:hypothetical protein RchiOBHm_Chr6g0245911 [Rosa chinensis]
MEGGAEQTQTQKEEKISGTFHTRVVSIRLEGIEKFWLQVN